VPSRRPPPRCPRRSPPPLPPHRPPLPALATAEHRRKKAAGNNAAVLPRAVDPERSRTKERMRRELGELGLDASGCCRLLPLPATLLPAAPAGLQSGLPCFALAADPHLKTAPPGSSCSRGRGARRAVAEPPRAQPGAQAGAQRCGGGRRDGGGGGGAQEAPAQQQVAVRSPPQAAPRRSCCQCAARPRSGAPLCCLCMAAGWGASDLCTW
jgi:hypothetical protein